MRKCCLRLSYSVKIDPMYGVFQSNSFHLDVCKNNMVPEKDYGLGVFLVIGSWNVSSDKRDINYKKISSNIKYPSNAAFSATMVITSFFQHDNDPKQTAHVVKICPATTSPDLNSIENLWPELDRKLNKRTC